MTEPDAESRPARASTAAWVVYDLANTIFALGVGSRYFSVWLIEERGGPDWYLSLATIAAMVVVIVAGPWLGTITDHVGRRRPYLVWTTVVAVVATALLATGDVAVSLVVYAVGTVGFHLGTVVYDAMLPDVSTPETQGRVSGLGVAVGYGGSLLALGIGAYVLPKAGYAAVFRWLAVAFAVFAMPAFLWIRERPRPRRPGRPPTILESPALLVDAWRQASHYPGVVRFLGARFLYTDAINTVFLFNAVFVKLEMGFTDRQTDLVALAGVFAAAIGAYAAGRGVDRFGPKPVLGAALYSMFVAIAAGVSAALLGIPALGWLVGVAGGLGVGAVWASDRVFMTHLSPPELLGEFFGLYAAVGRFATVLGPIVWALVADAMGLGRVAALGSLAIFLIAAKAVLGGVRDASPLREKAA